MLKNTSCFLCVREIKVKMVYGLYYLLLSAAIYLNKTGEIIIQGKIRKRILEYYAISFDRSIHTVYVFMLLFTVLIFFNSIK